MAIDEKKLLQSINDIIFDSLTGNAQGVGGGAQRLNKPDQSFLTLMNPGIAVYPPDFADAWSPTNVDGHVNKAENFARICDEVPTLEPIYKETGSAKWTAVATLLPLALGFIVTFLVARVWHWW